MPEQKGEQPNRRKFVVILSGVVGSFLIPILQSNGVTVNWQVSIFIYLCIGGLCTWSCLVDAIPNKKPWEKLVIGTLVFLFFEGLGAWATLKQYNREHAIVVAAEGTLTPEPTQHVMLGTELEIGPNGTRLMWLTADNIGPQLKFFYDAGLRIKDGPAGPLLSTPIRDREGHLVAEILDNHWKVYPNYSSDWNYNQNALEVKDSGGHVVLQVHLFQDRVQIQGEWHDQFGRGGRLMKDADQSTSSIAIWPDAKAEDRFKALIGPMFLYPSSAHLGEFAKRQ